MARFGGLSRWMVILMAWALSSCAELCPPEDDVTEDWEEACNTGYFYLNRGEVTLARPKFIQAINMKSDYVDAHAGLGRCEFLIGVKLLEIDPEGSEEAWKSFKRARQVFLKVIDLAPRDIRGYLGVGETLVRMGGMAEKAMPYIEKALALEPTNARGHFVKGMAWVELRDTPGCLYKAHQELLEAKRLGVLDPEFMQEVQRALEYVRELMRREDMGIEPPVEEPPGD